MTPGLVSGWQPKLGPCTGLSAVPAQWHVNVCQLSGMSMCPCLLQTGDLVYCRVVTAQRDMDPVLSCIDASGKAS